MIAYLKGKVKYKDEKSLILVCGNIGYQVVVPEYIIVESKQDDELELYTYQQISSRDESVELFGFRRIEEREFFKQLIGISGVGPRSAVGVLSIANLNELKKTISRGDPELLQKVAGIGKKTAERIVIELKDKLMHPDEVKPGMVANDADTDVFEALESLGYRAYDIREVLHDVPSGIETSEERIKAALKILSRH